MGEGSKEAWGHRRDVTEVAPVITGLVWHLDRTLGETWNIMGTREEQSLG